MINSKGLIVRCGWASLSLLLLSCILLFGVNNKAKAYTLSEAKKEMFSNIYSTELGPISACPENTLRDIAFCSEQLKNAGNAPFILLPIGRPKALVVLFHGLSDSPFFMRSLAQFLQTKGYMVIAPLSPGHGKFEADADMEDENLGKRWLDHVDKVMDFGLSFELPTVIGGFSTGGTFAAHYSIRNAKKLDALLLFSGALRLTSSAETMSKIWGIKFLAKILDGEYETMGPNPFKYPSVASYSALVLMDLIKDVRGMLEETTVRLPIFAAHSLADNVTLFEGIEETTSAIEGKHTIFKIDEEFDMCHADLPISSAQLIGLDFDKSQVNENERCAVPKANPLHSNMLLMLESFLQEHVNSK
ncbi:alpha/beta hydrolase [Glaciecola petra]|uniref:Alpha/beta hydrolase n=1 Tax=Glaciecola petra TaxID=3075602 RepID=A0ABU2ZML1_9ALTE|nr:alpha/beta hydrolase [Aestuariibacter sp. P117]MDT0593486.1 alpha/beta hydrolase [Aestuariibacter sp. P117]